MDRTAQKFNQHLPVLLTETIDGLVTDPAGIYVDATFGRGGHARVLLEKLDQKGKLWCLDKDWSAINVAQQLDDSRVTVKQGSFTKLASWLQEDGVTESLTGILMDLGVSSPQLDDATRGFSFLHDGPLDMRMDQQSSLTAAKWLNSASVEELADTIYKYGDERFSRKIARAIVDARMVAPLATTRQLAQLIERVLPTALQHKHRHPATKTFQAIRIMVNQELQELTTALPQFLELLKVGGRFAIITFHSLEDQIVKKFIRQNQGGDIPSWVPLSADALGKRVKILQKIKVSDQEAAVNPRARSAKLWVVEKIK